MCSVDELVEDYIKRHRRNAARELEYFGRFPRTDEDAVRRAALSQLPLGKRHNHQRLIPAAVLEESARVLVEATPRLRKATSFDELLELVEDLILPIHGVGEMVVYDTAHRIGARFGLEPGSLITYWGRWQYKAPVPVGGGAAQIGGHYYGSCIAWLNR